MLKLRPAESAPGSIRMPHLKNKEAEKRNDQEKMNQQQIIIEPEVIRFAGFEVGKLNLLKIKVINKGTQAQRILVIPPKTNFFNVKYDKRGAIPPGMFDEIYVSLKPYDYKYYQDTMRINTFQESILIPIHAYPAINRDYLRDLFPRYLDFGALEIGEHFAQRFPIQNKVPLNFDFEFIVIKDNFDFKITPLKGVIPDKGVMEIEIMYRPTINVTVYMEVELMIGQRDFEPLPIKLMGTGRSQNDKTISRIRRPQSTRKLHSIIASPPKQNQKIITKDIQSSQENIDEYSIPEQSPQVIYEAADGNEQVDQFIPMVKPSARRNRPQIIENEIVEIKQGTQLQGRQVKEKLYLDNFNQIANLDKEKENKLRQYIGDPKIEQESVNEILQQREQYNQQIQNQIQNTGLTRYQLQLDIDNAVVDQILPKYECQWDFEKNDVLKIKKINQHLIVLKLKKFVYAVTRVIYRIRFDNRMSKIRAFLRGATKRSEVEKLVNQDWQKAEYAGVGKKDIISFSFEFEENCIGKFTLPVQFQETNTYSQFKFDINPRTGFDDWAPIEQIPQSDQEVMQYKNWDYPQLVYHPPLLQEIVTFREGAEEEKAIKGKMGPLQNFLKFSKLDEFVKLALSKQPEFEGVSLLLPHKTLKFFIPYDTMNQTESYYLLDFRRVENLGADLDPDQYISHFIIKQEISNKQPGYNTLPLLYELKLEQFYYQERNMQLSYDFGFEDQIEQYCSSLMHDKEADDYITDDSDEERAQQPIVVNYNDWLDKLEQDDKALIQYKQQEDIIDQQEQLKQKIDRSLMFEKNKWISTIPSKTNDYNKFISTNGIKMVIL